MAIESLKLGAQDYLLKNEITPALLLKSISYSIERNKVRLQLVNEQHSREIEISDAVISALENEKASLSQELHDNVAQLMASAVMFLTLAKRKNDKFQFYTEEALNIVVTATAELRSLSHVLAPPQLNHETLDDALAHLVKKISKSSELEIVSEWEPDDLNELPEKMALHIFRMVQEQMNNILKHASAKHVLVKLFEKEERVFLEIKDDGIGFDISKKSDGLGLRNIKTRAKLFDGNATIVSSPSNGCLLQVELKNTNRA
jgi:signal transduction histidine kinase